MSTLTGLHTALAAHRQSPSRDTLTALMEAGVALAAKLNATDDRLHAMWVWLDAHPEHPEYETRENAMLELIQKYQAAHDALGETVMALGEV